MAIVEGYVTDKQTGQPVPYATMTVRESFPSMSNVGVSTVADASGHFILNSSSVKEGNDLVVSSVGYGSVYTPLHNYNKEINFELQRDIIELDPVIVKPTKVNKTVLWGGAALLALLAMKNKAKRKVSGLFPGGAITDTLMPVLLVGGVVIILKYGDDILEKFGIKKSEKEKAAEDAATNPDSFWNPGFWKKGGAGTLILTGTAVQQLLTLLDYAFGAFNDDEQMVIGAFKQLKTQSQLSYFADQFRQKKGGDLATWLYKGSYPNDRLSLSEFGEINDYISKLPMYKP